MRRRPGILLLSFVAAVTAVTPTLADWNETHIYHPGWSPHAKFHVGHTMLLGAVLGVLALGFLWRRAGDARDNLRTASLVLAAYWIAQAGAVLVPGTAMVDPEYADRLPTVAGLRLNQVILDAILLSLVAAGYLWQRAILPRPPRS